MTTVPEFCEVRRQPALKWEPVEIGDVDFFTLRKGCSGGAAREVLHRNWFDDEVGVIDGKVQDRRIEKTRNDVRHERRRASFGDDGMNPGVGLGHLAEHWEIASCDGR